MLKDLEDFYKSAETSYNELEKEISEQASENYEDAKNYIQETSDEISIFIDNYFNADNSRKITDSEDSVLQQLNKLKISINNQDQEPDSRLIYVATSIGHLNEKIVIILCKHYNIKLFSNDTQSKKINFLKNHLSKTIINDLYFINSFRNSIVHFNDFGHDLSQLDEIIKNKLFSEASTAIAKFEFVYLELKKIKIKQS